MVGRKFIFEADDDAEATNNNDENTATNNDNGSDENNTDDNANEDDGVDADGDGQDDNEEYGDDDFTINDDNDNDDDNNEGDNPTSASDMVSSDNSEDPPLDPESLKAKDRKLFDSLSIPEQRIKVKELKMMFGELYTNCNNIVDRFNSLSFAAEDIAPQVRRAMNIVFELRNMISSYILNIYDTKSYIENDIEFNRFLSILNSVKNVMKSIKSEQKDTN